MSDIKLVGICGGSASGKTAITQRISLFNRNQVASISQDSYYKSYDELSLEEKKRVNYDHPDAFDIKLLTEHLQKLKKGSIINSPVYSFSKYSREKETIIVEPKKIIIIEGMLILHYPEIRSLLDDSIYIDATENTRLNRMILRDVKDRGRTVDGVIKQYTRDMKPMHDTFVEPLKQYANIIINGNLEEDEVYRNIISYLVQKGFLNSIEDLER